MKEKIKEISLSMERGHRRILRVLSALAVIGLFAALWKWRGLAAMEPIVEGGQRRWLLAIGESIAVSLAAQWVLYLLPWPLLALFGRTAPFCSVFSLRPCVGSKAELSRAAVSPDELPFDTVLTVSARTGAGLDALPALLEGWFLGENACDGSLLTNPRQFGALDRASRAIERAKTGLCLGVTPDAVLTDVEEAMAALGEVTGRTVREDITNRIFERFCVGK